MSIAIRNQTTPQYTIQVGNPFIFGSSIQMTITGNNNMDDFSCLNEAYINMSLLATNSAGPVQPFEIKKNLLSWIQSTQIMYKDKHDHVINETGQNHIGEVAGLKLLIDNSYSKTVDEARMTFAIAPITQTTAKFIVSIPLKFLIDMFATKRFLPMKEIMLNLQFDSINNLFNFPGPNPNTYNITCVQAYLNFKQYTLAVPNSDRFFLRPEKMKTYTTTYGIQVGQTVVNLQITIPGRMEYCCFYFGNAESQYNSWGYSLPQNIQIQTGGGLVFPNVPTYTVDFYSSNPTGYDPTYGYNRFYYEFLSVMEKLSFRNDTYITVDRYLSDYRVYCVETLNEHNINQTYQLTVTQNAPSLANQTMTVWCAYEPIMQLEEAEMEM